MLYPILFKPIYKEMVWGGTKMRTALGRTLPSEKTGESWDISCRSGEMSVVENGPDAGMPFDQLIARDPEKYLGRMSRLTDQTVASHRKRFPLLVKIIDANEHLSVQVHPSDELAGVLERGADSANGKNEMWYVIDAPEDGYLIAGVRAGVTAAALREALTAGAAADPEGLFNRLPVKPGDIVNIPAGLIHAITKGVLIAEIQQNSDVTYRLFDYNRVGLDGKPRELHLEKGLTAAVLDCEVRQTVPGLTVAVGPHKLIYAVANPYFAVIKYEIDGVYEETGDGMAFSVFTCVAGSCVVTADGLTDYAASVACGRSAFIPAGVEKLRLEGHCTLLKSFCVADVNRVFMDPLRAFGYSDDEIAAQTALSVASS